MAPNGKVKCHESDVTVVGRGCGVADNWLRLVWGGLLLGAEAASIFHSQCQRKPRGETCRPHSEGMIELSAWSKCSQSTLVVLCPACCALKQVPKCPPLRVLNPASFQTCLLYSLVALSW